MNKNVFWKHCNNCFCQQRGCWIRWCSHHLYTNENLDHPRYKLLWRITIIVQELPFIVSNTVGQCSILVWSYVISRLHMWLQLMWMWAFPAHLSKISSKVKKAVPVNTFQKNLAIIFLREGLKGEGSAGQRHYTNPALLRHVSWVLQDAKDKRPMQRNVWL